MYRVSIELYSVEAQVEGWENKKCCGNMSHRQVFPQVFQVLPNCHKCFYNTKETLKTCFVFLLEKENQLVYFDHQM